MRVVLLVFLCAASASAQPARGGLWSAVGADNGVWALTTAPDGGVYAGGSFQTVAGDSTGAVARWDGTEWHRIGDIRGTVSAIAVGPDSRVLAVGSLGGLDPGGSVCAAQWDGESWTPLAAGCSILYAATFLPDGTPVVGRSSYGPDRSAVARWDGAAWVNFESSAEARLNGWIWALAVGPDGTLYAGGEPLYLGDGPSQGCVARWDGTAWQPVGGDLRAGSNYGDCVYSLAFGPDGALYAGGYFTVGDVPVVQDVARWDGTAWTALPRGFVQTGVWNLAIATDGQLYAAAGSAPTLTVWDGATWQVASHVSDSGAYALTSDGADGLFVGGSFSSIGGVASPNLARYTVPPVATEAPPEVLSFTIAPNPAAGPVQLVAPRAGRVDVLDTQGRTVRTLDVAAGAATLPTAGLAPGLYLVRLTAGADVVTRTLVVSR